MLDSSGAAVSASLPFQGGGVFIPWGIAVDGNDTVWVASLGGRRVTQLRGANPGGDGVVVFIGLAGPVKTPLIGPVQQP